MVRTCVACGGAVEESVGPIEWDVRGNVITVEGVPHGLCTQCGEVYFADGVSDEVQKRAVDACKSAQGLLSASEIRLIRRSLGLSQAKFERLLGAGPKTAVRWENGTVFQNRTTDTLMRVLRDYPFVAEDLKAKLEII